MKQIIAALTLGLLVAAPASAFHLKVNLGPEARIGFFALDPEEPMFLGITSLELRGSSFTFVERATRPFPKMPIIDIPFANPLVVFRIFWAPWVDKGGVNDHMHQNAGHLDGEVKEDDSKSE